MNIDEGGCSPGEAGEVMVSEQVEFPIPLFEYLVWVEKAMHVDGGYMSRSRGRRLEKTSTAARALELMEDATAPLRKEKASDFDFMRALRVWHWAYHLESSKDLLHKIARTGVVRRSDLGHAASMLSEYDKRFELDRAPRRIHMFPRECDPSPKEGDDGRARFVDELETLFWQRACKKPVFSRDKRRDDFLVEVDIFLKLALRAFAYEGEFLRLPLTVAVFEIGELASVVDEYGRATGATLLKELWRSVRNQRWFEALQDGARSHSFSQGDMHGAACVGGRRIAVLVNKASRDTVAAFLRRVIERFETKSFSIGDHTMTPRVCAGVTDFLDYPLPARTPAGAGGVCDLDALADFFSRRRPEKLLAHAVAALKDAQKMEGSSVAMFEPEVVRQRRHVRTPEVF